VYAVAAALTVLVLERVPLGGEQVKALLVGSLLGVTGDDVVRLAALYGAVGVACWLARRPLAALSFGGTLRHARVWDFGFYLLFGLVVTSSVRVAGVLLVFAYLIVPAVAGALLARDASRRLVIGWSVGALGQRRRHRRVISLGPADRRDDRRHAGRAAGGPGGRAR